MSIDTVVDNVLFKEIDNDNQLYLKEAGYIDGGGLNLGYEFKWLTPCSSFATSNGSIKFDGLTLSVKVHQVMTEYEFKHYSLHLN